MLRRLGYRNRSSLGCDFVVAFPFVELVLRESPVGEHATNGVAESAMRKVKRQTRTLNFCSGGACGKDL